MKNLLMRLWSEDEGVLTFEWILLISLLVIAMIAALATVRDNLINELSDVAVSISLINQSFSIANPPSIECSKSLQNTTSSQIDIRKNNSTIVY